MDGSNLKRNETTAKVFHLTAALTNVIQENKTYADEINKMSVLPSVKKWSSDQIDSYIGSKMMSELYEESVAGTLLIDFVKKQGISNSKEFGKRYLENRGLGLVDLRIIHKILSTKKRTIVIVLGLSHALVDIEPILDQLNYNFVTTKSLLSENELADFRADVNERFQNHAEMNTVIKASNDLIKNSLPEILNNR